MPREVVLKSDSDKRYVKVSFPDMKYVGFWQEYSEDTPFLCIEPWCAPPANLGYVCDIFERDELYHLDAGEEKEITLTLGYDELGYYDERGKYMVERGDFDVFVGDDSMTQNKIRIRIV
jgi:hypothetical protein